MMILIRCVTKRNRANEIGISVHILPGRLLLFLGVEDSNTVYNFFF